MTEFEMMILEKLNSIDNRLNSMESGQKKMQADIKELQNAQVEMLNRQEQLASDVKSIKITLENEVAPSIKTLTEYQIDDSHRLQSIEKDVQELNDNMAIDEVIAGLQELKVNH